MIATKTEQQREAKGKALVGLGLVVVALMVACLVLTATPAQAKTFTVNSTGDTGDQNPGDGSCITGNFIECTLRAAIEEANKFPGADTIEFQIGFLGGTDLRTITPGSELPTIAKPLTIDGYTQGGATKNTLTEPGKTDADLKIELDGTNAAFNASGLVIEASNVVVRGLVINSFGGRGIRLFGGTGHKVEGNFIGTDPSGNVAEGNDYGMQLFETDNSTIGGTSHEARNLISGNDFIGVVAALGASGNKIQGNLIGTNRTGTAPLGNNTYGVFVFSSKNTIGDSDPTDGLTNAANTIAFNDGPGMAMFTGTNLAAAGNRILSNSIFSNGGPGIDLRGDSVTPNDPKDPDTGPNRLQNYPVLDPIVILPSDTSVTVRGELNSTPSTRKKKRTFIIQFFSSPEKDASNHGEGKTFLGQTLVKTDRQGNAPISFSTQEVLEGEYITATATNRATGDTSEFSQARVVEVPGTEG